MSAMSEIDFLLSALSVSERYRKRQQIESLLSSDSETIRVVDAGCHTGLIDDCYDILCGDYGEAAKSELEGLLGRVYVADQLRLDLDCQGYALIREEV